MRVLIVGAEGLLGTSVQRVARADHRVSEVVAAGHGEVDITERRQVRAAVRDVRPDLVVNTAVLMPADRCDDNPEEAYAVNALGARWVSRCSAEVGARTVYITTDFVFDGESGQPYGPGDVPRPLLTYGTTKLAGEHETRLGNDRHLILRTAGLFGPRPISERARACFVDRMLDRALGGTTLDVVEHIRMSPTYTADLGRTVLDLAATGVPDGTYHTVNQGVASWYEVCREALSYAGITDRVRPTRSNEFTSATRPPSTPLQCTAPGGMRDWRSALHDYLATSRPRRAAVPA